MSFDADVERLQSSLEQPSGEGVGRLSPENHLLPHFLDVRGRSADYAREHVVMAVQVLRRRVDDDVGTVLAESGREN